MASRQQKQSDIEETKEWFYNKFFQRICSPLADDYVSVRDAYWVKRIEAGETTLEKFRKVWKRDIFGEKIP